MSPISVAIADDHELVRYGLTQVMESRDDMAVVGEAGTGREAVDKTCELHPDVLILDLRMPELDGIEACRQIVERCPQTKVLVLSSFDGDEDVFGALSAGASGYVMKSIAPQALMRTICEVAEGRTVLDGAIARRVIADHPRPRSEAIQEALSDRELEVLKLMAKGLSNKEIGESLWIGETTVKTHVSSILHKLGKTQRMQAILAAVRDGLVDIPPEA